MKHKSHRWHIYRCYLSHRSPPTLFETRNRAGRSLTSRLLSSTPLNLATMAVASIQDRTSEFKSVLAQAQRKQSSSKVSSQRRSLLTDAQKDAANGHAGGPPRRSEFARKAAEIGRGISATMGKLEKLAQCEYYLPVSATRMPGVVYSLTSRNSGEATNTFR